jgi:hypothetical protein
MTSLMKGTRGCSGAAQWAPLDWWCVEAGHYLVTGDAVAACFVAEVSGSPAVVDLGHGAHV